MKGFNTNSLGICFIRKSGKFTDNQLNSSLELIYQLENQFRDVELYQHGELDKAKPFYAVLDMTRFNENYQLFKELKKLKEINEQLKQEDGLPFLLAFLY